MKKKLLLPILTIGFILSSNISNAQKMSVGFYNVENLYDTINDPSIDDEEFLPTGKNKWSQERYTQKISQLNKSIDEFGEILFLGLCEIENQQVVRDLVNYNSNRKKKMGIVHYDSPDKRGIDVALIYDSSKAKLLYSKYIRFNLPDEKKPTRDILASKFLVKKDTVHILVNHWPSRSGGQEKSEPKRIFAALQAKKYIDSVLAINPKSKIILMGDLNDYPQDKAPSIISEKLTPLISKQSNIYGGSYNYRGEWDVLDHIMVSKEIINAKKKFRYIENTSQIISTDFLLEKSEKNIQPFRTYAKGYQGGFSDHLPVKISVKL